MLALAVSYEMQCHSTAADQIAALVQGIVGSSREGFAARRAG